MADTGPGTKEPAVAWNQAITGLSEALAELEAQGKPMDAKAFRKAQKSSQDLQEGHSAGNKSLQYVKALLCPCTICCSTRGQAIGKSSNNKLIGMTAVMDYVISCKNAPVQYHWSIQSYHFERHSCRDSDGNRQTREERVDTHFARTGGALVSTESTPPFQPNVVKQSVAMRCKLDASPDDSFKQEYEHRKHMFYQSNTTDSHQDHREWTTLGPMKPAVHAAWVDQEDPWYANGCVRNLAALTPLTAPCWLKAMNGSALRPRHRDRSRHRRDPARRLYGQADGHVQEDVLGIRGSSEDAEEPARHRLRPLTLNSLSDLPRRHSAAVRPSPISLLRVILPFDSIRQ